MLRKIYIYIYIEFCHFWRIRFEIRIPIIIIHGLVDGLVIRISVLNCVLV